jgi:hypothetical protein
LMEGNGGRYSGSVNFELAEIGGSQNPRCSVLLVRAQSGKPESTKPTSPVEPAAKAPAK